MSCIDCIERTPGCHSRCFRYKADKEKRVERVNTIYQARMIEAMANSVQVENCLRTSHKKGSQR